MVQFQPSSPAGPRPHLPNCDGPDGPTFAVRIEPRAGTLRLTGRLERSTTHLFMDAVSALLYAGCPSWVVDLSDLTDCDATGLRAICVSYRRALRHDRRMRLVGTPPALRAALRRLHLDTHLLLEDTHPEPVSA
jgi:anti-sigma B factor antagonist